MIDVTKMEFTDRSTLIMVFQWIGFMSCQHIYTHIHTCVFVCVKSIIKVKLDKELKAHPWDGLSNFPLSFLSSFICFMEISITLGLNNVENLHIIIFYYINTKI